MQAKPRPEGRTESWRLPYKTPFRSPPRASAAWTTGPFPLLPGRHTTIPLAIGALYQPRRDAQPRSLGGEQTSVGRAGAAPRGPTPGGREPLGAGSNVCAPGTQSVARTGRREPLAAQVQGSEAALAPDMSSCWPGSSAWGQRGQRPLPGPPLQAVRPESPLKARPVWSGAELSSQSQMSLGPRGQVATQRGHTS